ncbi:MAG: hypothetical protein ACYC06_02255 [Ilumatobacteraceae bacterium]
MTSQHPVLAELRERGDFGVLGIEMLKIAATSVIRTHKFPPPDGHPRWTEDDISDVVTDWAYDSAKGQKRLRMLLASVSTDMRLRGYLAKSIINHLRSEARQTEFGARLLAVRAHVKQDKRVHVGVRPNLYSLLTSVGRPPYSGEHHFLFDAAATIPVRSKPWETEKRRNPIASHDTIIGIVIAILERANSPVMEDLVVRIVLRRCGVILQIADVSFGAEHERAEEVFHGLEVEANAVSKFVDTAWAVLKPRQKLLVHALVDELSVRDIEATLGIARQTAYRDIGRIEAILHDLLKDHPDQAHIMEELTARSRALADGTADTGATSLP